MSTLLLLPILSMLLWTDAHAHGGGTDASGCHTNRKTGDYHCHGGGSSYRSYGYQAPRTYTNYEAPAPQRTRKPPVTFTCTGTSFVDPTNGAYTYCPVSGGYGINKDGDKTGIATYGSPAYDAIKALEPAPAPIKVEAPPATPKEVEEDNSASYVFRAFLGVLVAIYIGVLILSKDARGGGLNFLLVPLAAWSAACVFGWISIWVFFAPFLILLLLIVAIFGLIAGAATLLG